MLDPEDYAKACMAHERHARRGFHAESFAQEAAAHAIAALEAAFAARMTHLGSTSARFESDGQRMVVFACGADPGPRGLQAMATLCLAPSHFGSWSVRILHAFSPPRARARCARMILAELARDEAAWLAEHPLVERPEGWQALLDKREIEQATPRALPAPKRPTRI